MNSPVASKINYTALLIQIVGILVVFDVIPKQIEQQVVEITLIVGPALIQVFRTWFTAK
jgi:ACR3 family arsenite efflux pump ArsB